MVIYRDAEEKFIKRVELYVNEAEAESDAIYLYHDREFTSKVTKEELLDVVGMLAIIGYVEDVAFYFYPKAVEVRPDYAVAVSDITAYTAEYVPEPDDSEGP